MKKFEMSRLFKKTLLVTSILFLLVMVTISVAMATRIQDQLYIESNSKGLAIAKSIADAGIELILNSDAATLQSKIDQFLEIDGVAYIIVRNSRREILSHTLVPDIPSILTDHYDRLFQQPAWNDSIQTVRLKEPDGLNVLDVSVPIISGEIGVVHVGMNLNPIIDEIQAVIARMVLILFSVYIIGIFSLFILMSKISQPLQRLMSYARQLSEHHFRESHQLQPEIKDIANVTKDEIGDLSRTLVDMEDHLISNIQTLEQTVAAKQQIETELKVATDIQMSMLPKDGVLNDIDVCKLSGYMKPAKEVGGDFYDYFKKGTHELCFLVGDVSGKGASAALFMAMTLTLLRSVSQQMNDVSEIVSHVNQYLCSNNDGGLFVTLWMGVLNYRTGELRYVNAGHNAPLIKHESGDVSELPLTDGIVLGFDDSHYFQSGQYTMAKNETIMVVTDGITEAMTANHDLYGDDRLITCLSSMERKDPDDMNKTLLGNVHEFVGGAEQHDDMTLLTLNFEPKPIEISNPFKVHFKNDVSEIAKLHQVIELFSRAQSIPEIVAMNANLVLEELLSNTIFYGYQDHEEHLIYVTLSYNQDRLNITCEDDGIAFNPLEKEDVDMTTSLDETDVGGLGIHFVKNLTESVSYKRENNLNIIQMTLTENKEATDV